MKKKLLKKIKLTLNAGKATPVPPVSKLNEYKINVSSFCKEYNDLSKGFIGFKIPVEIFIYKDKTFSLKLKTPLTSFLALKLKELKKGSGKSNKEKLGIFSKDEIFQLTKQKLNDLNTKDLEKAFNIIKGTVKSLGFLVEN